MKVSELMVILAPQPQNRRVVVDGYDGGLDDVDTVSEAPIVPDAFTVPQILGHVPNTIPNDYGTGAHAFAKPGQDGEIAVYIRRLKWHGHV